jgi:hypothetical protein
MKLILSQSYGGNGMSFRLEDISLDELSKIVVLVETDLKNNLKDKENVLKYLDDDWIELFEEDIRMDKNLLNIIKDDKGRFRF